MTYRIQITARARSDADEAYSWIRFDQGDPVAAERWYQGLKTALLSLQYSPKRCSRAPESSPGRDVRQLLYHRHRILFVIEADAVHVLLVRHAGRRPARAAELKRALREDPGDRRR